MTRSVRALFRRRGRLQSRASERGAAIFVVILVLTILTAIGVFAARAAGMNQRLSGYSRQATQTGYVAEYGAMHALSELRDTETGKAHIGEMKKGGNCIASSGIDGGGAPIPCYKFTSGRVQNALDDDAIGATLFDPNGGSLGVTEQPTMAVFSAEVTDPYKAPPRPGKDLTGITTTTTGRSIQVTITATGQVRPVSAGDPDAGVCSTAEEQMAAQLSGTRTLRMVVEVPQ